MVTQILFVHGGMTFGSREKYLEWLKSIEIDLDRPPSFKNSLGEDLGEDFEVQCPQFPLKQNAYYEDWKIIFEKYLEVLGNDIILIGISLGGIFLARYLSENKIEKNIISVYLIAPPFDDTLPGEELCNGFELKDDLSLITKNCSNVKFMFSKDDDVVPISHANKFKEKLPEAEYIIYESKNGHFNISEFPELVSMIKEDVK